MDELWQRYRTFWMPVLIGIGVLLIGVIAIYVINDDPDETAKRLSNEGAKLNKMVQPTSAQIKATKENVTLRHDRVETLAKRLDQTGLAADPMEAAVAQALTASILRGGGGADAFDGDEAAASAARSRYERTLRERVDLLRSGDPTVGWSGLLSHVWSDLRLRANRADVDIDTGADQLGFAVVSSVNRATLLQRLLNLALAARLMDLAIRNGVHSVNEIRFEQRQNPGPDAFLLEWPVTIGMTGTMDSLRPVLAELANPERSVPLLSTRLELPKRAVAGKEGLVELSVTAVSLRVQPAAALDLAVEEDPR